MSFDGFKRFEPLEIYRKTISRKRCEFLHGGTTALTDTSQVRSCTVTKSVAVSGFSSGPCDRYNERVDDWRVTRFAIAAITRRRWGGRRGQGMRMRDQSLFSREPCLAKEAALALFDFVVLLFFFFIGAECVM